jgi:hypothetical protein
LHNLAEQRVRLGEYVQARITLAESREISRDLGEHEHQAVDDVLLAYLDGIGGDANAPDKMRAVVGHFRDASHPFAELHARYWLGKLLLSNGDAEAPRELGRALELARELKIRTYDDDFVRMIAELGG